MNETITTPFKTATPERAINGEVKLAEQMNLKENAQRRTWEYWGRRAGFKVSVND